MILLVLCNIALILTIWVKPGLRPFGKQTGGPRDFVIQSLEFTPDQVKQYDALITTHKQAMDQYRKTAMDCRMQLFNDIKNSAHPTINADSLAQVIANGQKQVELVTYNHFVQVRAICTDAQKARLDRIIGEVMKRMNGNNRGGKQGPPPDGGQSQDRPGPPENE